MSETQDKLPPRKQDAIHRALLTGLLGNIGEKTDAHEYTGLRGKKFHLFPGSALFRQRPPWVMSAELVETTRLNARTVAGIRPDWVERVAEHLVKRDYADPHWDHRLERVIAWERVAFHGLVLVPKRKVHYGPIDPSLSREIFIHHALVLGEYRTDAPFLAHNRKLVEKIRGIEAKLRRQDVLVDQKVRYAFYDVRVPQRVYTAQEFEKWRRQGEKRNPRLLFMTPQELMLHAAAEVTPESHPDALTVNGLSVPLTYRFDLGHPDDGITATIPLASLNQLAPEPFDWLVPGFRKEEFVALIRSLPKALRVKFVPVPEVAERAAEELSPAHGTLPDALATFLGKLSGETVRAQDFQLDVLPDYLRMNYKVVDSTGKPVATGRDLEEIRKRLGMKARQSFADMPPTEWHRDHVTHWDFGDLPEVVEIRRSGLTLSGYPALVDNAGSVSLRLFDAPDAAKQAMRGGLRRLFMLQLREEMKFLSRHLPDVDALGLHYATVGSCAHLKRDLIEAIADRAFFDDIGIEPRTREAFAAQAEAGWRRLNTARDEILEPVRQSLELYHALSRDLSASSPPLWDTSIRDMRGQLSYLVYDGFVAQTTYVSLRHLPRYLKGIELRFRKLANAGLNRELANLAEVSPLWQQYRARAEKHRREGVSDPALEQYRWMIEELRVSLFAQELKTAIPISVQRVQKQWEQVKS